MWENIFWNMPVSWSDLNPIEHNDGLLAAWMYCRPICSKRVKPSRQYGPTSDTL
jgi:hypothetical protein